MNATGGALVVIVAMGAVACGAFLADSGDDDRPGTSSGQVPADAGDAAATSEGGSLVDGEAPPIDAGKDSAPTERRATCGKTTCAPDSVCCLADNGSAACLPGEQTCVGNSYACTRNGDCLEGEQCCIALDSLLPGSSSSTCVAGGCVGDSRTFCSTDDPPEDTGCKAVTTCRPDGVAGQYGLPPGGPFGLCQ